MKQFHTHDEIHNYSSNRGIEEFEELAQTLWWPSQEQVEKIRTHLISRKWNEHQVSN